MPAQRNVYDILNRLDYRLLPARKIRPQKNPEIDAFFDHWKQVHTYPAVTPTTQRISPDTKAKWKIVAFSRCGMARGQDTFVAADHDTHPGAMPHGNAKYLVITIHK